MFCPLNPGLTIPANQTFLLGESNDKSYSYGVSQQIKFDSYCWKAVSKKSGEVTQSFGLAPKGRTKVVYQQR